MYDLDYFTGNSAVLYIGDVFVDEVTSFAFTVQQNKTPIYGYASQLFDDVAAGQVIVQGSFSINFKESGYLWLILHRYKKFQHLVDTQLDKYAKFNNQSGTVVGSAQSQVGGKVLLGGPNNPFARIKNNNQDYDFISRAPIERILSGEASVDERTQFCYSLAGYCTSSNPNATDKAFEDIVEVFEDQVYQDNITDIDNMARRVDDNFFDDFDMFLVYGDYSKPGANHTVRRIRNVRMLSTSQQVGISGESVQEVYTFLARNII
ncbi:MAG TPA: hypothetical protein VKR58_02030, partial [Aquella sp.]|nr:hypothetical protein [Aquella sp.]